MTEIVKIFALVGEYAFELGIRNINKLSGCWEKQIDKSWFIAINGHSRKIKINTSQMDFELEPFSVYVEYNGFPTGVFDASGGEFAAGPKVNEDYFIDFINKKILELKQKVNESIGCPTWNFFT